MKLRRPQVRADQLVDVTVERRRQQEALAACRRLAHQLVDDRVEAQVAQVVGLVEDSDLDVVHAAGATVDQVLEATRRGDDDVGPVAQLLDLAVVGRAAAHRGQLQVNCLGEGLQRAAYLGGELTRGYDDQGARVLRAATVAGEPGKDRQAESQCLAGAGLRAAEHVMSGQRVGNDGRLDGGRGGDVLAGKGLHQFRREVERVECDARLGRGVFGQGRLSGSHRKRNSSVVGRVLARIPRRGPASLRDARHPITGPARQLLLTAPRTHTGRQLRPAEFHL